MKFKKGKETRGSMTYLLYAFLSSSHEKRALTLKLSLTRVCLLLPSSHKTPKKENTRLRAHAKS
jgi:hypothetical protein